ncbi:hypothetical protein IAT40_004592 [Kwoniella sp. CBS 6097]
MTVFNHENAELARRICELSANDSKRAKELLGHVRIFSLREHHSGWCKPNGPCEPLELPSLQALHLYAAYKNSNNFRLYYGHGMRSCPYRTEREPTRPSWFRSIVWYRKHPETFDCPNVAWWNTPLPKLEPIPCPLISALRPKTMVIRNYSCVKSWVDKTEDDLPTLTRHEDWYSEPYPSTEIFSQVETLVLVYPACNAGASDWRLSTCEPKIAPNLKRIFWIIDPTPPQAIWRRVPNSEKQKALYYNRALGRLAATFEYTPITIVNFEAAWTYNDNWKKVEGCTRTNMEPYMLRQLSRHFADLPDLAIEARRDIINFLTLDEYMAQEDWVDILEAEEMERWTSLSKRSSGGEM